MDGHFFTVLLTNTDAKEVQFSLHFKNTYVLKKIHKIYKSTFEQACSLAQLRLYLTTLQLYFPIVTAESFKLESNDRKFYLQNQDIFGNVFLIYPLFLWVKIIWWMYHQWNQDILGCGNASSCETAAQQVSLFCNLVFLFFESLSVHTSPRANSTQSVSN